jgi:nucleotide-binding universal stress UspA family protein
VTVGSTRQLAVDLVVKGGGMVDNSKRFDGKDLPVDRVAQAPADPSFQAEGPFAAARPAGYERIVVPLDGSPFARTALAPAAWLARELGAGLVLVRASTRARVPWIGPDLGRQLGESDAARSLAEAAESHVVAGLPVSQVLITGALANTPAEAILTAVREAEADLVVMATHGRTGLERAVLGSVADAVVSTSPVPVLLVHPQRHEAPMEGVAGSGRPEGPRLLVALDGSHEAEAALAPAADLAKRLLAQLELARVLTHTAAPTLPEGPSAVRAAARYLDERAQALRQDGVPAGRVHTSVLYANGRDVADTLLAHAEHSHAALLVIATRARRGLARFLRGSVEAEAAARAPLPILVVRARREAAAAR